MGGVSVAVAQAMRYAGCPNRRSLGVREVFPPFCEFDRGLYARSCPLCEIPLVGNYRCDNCSGGRVARMWA